MPHPFARTELLLGRAGMERLAAARVAVFGLGGVGGHAAEALARSGVGALDLIDSDTVSLSNLNRQILALHSTIGRYKVDVAAERIADVNPAAVVRGWKLFLTPETAGQLPFADYDYIIDAIDTVTGKLTLVEQAMRAGVPIISSMGAGNRLDPTAFTVTDVYSTSDCPLARVMRRELRRRGVPALKVVCSKEPPTPPEASPDLEEAPAARRQIPGSTAFVPAVAGLILAGEVVRALAGEK